MTSWPRVHVRCVTVVGDIFDVSLKKSAGSPDGNYIAVGNKVCSHLLILGRLLVSCTRFDCTRFEVKRYSLKENCSLSPKIQGRESFGRGVSPSRMNYERPRAKPEFWDLNFVKRGCHTAEGEPNQEWLPCFSFPAGGRPDHDRCTEVQSHPCSAFQSWGVCHPNLWARFWSHMWILCCIYCILIYFIFMLICDVCKCVYMWVFMCVYYVVSCIFTFFLQWFSAIYFLFNIQCNRTSHQNEGKAWYPLQLWKEGKRKRNTIFPQVNEFAWDNSGKYLFMTTELGMQTCSAN